MDNLVSGFTGVAIDKIITQILHHISIPIHYRRELQTLANLVSSIRPLILQIQQYRPALNRKTGIPTSGCYRKASAVDGWLRTMELLLRQALEVVQMCKLPWYNVILRYQLSRRITPLISDIKEHLTLSPLVELAQIPELLEELRQGMGQTIQESVEAALASSSTPSATTSESVASRGFLINEPLIVGQDKASARLEKLVMDTELSRIGVVGKGGSGKTLLLKTLFNTKKVRHAFTDGFLLWLTVSQWPSFQSLRKELSAQIAMKVNVALEQNMNEEDVKSFLNENMQAKRFALFLDDVWGEGAKLLEELGVPLRSDHSNNSKVIVSSRDRRALLEMGVHAEASMITMEDLIENESWELFRYHAFPHNEGNPPANIDEGTAKLVCANCGGLPLAIKAIGRAMSGIIDKKEWELAVRSLPNHSRQDLQDLNDRLRWSYDALGRYDLHLQLCFLYSAAAFIEDKIIPVEAELIPLWIGEGLLQRKNVQDDGDHDPFETGRIYTNILADRCLIEPTLRDGDGRVVRFRVHDVLRDLAIQIAEREENFYCRAGRRLTGLNENECSSCTRIMLNDNELSLLPEPWRAPAICSLLMARNLEIPEIPRKVMGSMVSLKVLDLTATSLTSLPESVGCLEQLLCLLLTHVPITRLPASLTNLASLEVLDVGNSKITVLPFNIHKLRSLRYLRLRDCKDLHFLPRSLSRLTSLRYLNIDGCESVWSTGDQKKKSKNVASINDLGTLIHLKRLLLQNNGETIREGAFGRMGDMETLHLKLTEMASLPGDMIHMSKLRRLELGCPQVVKMVSKSCDFQNLSHLRLWGCLMLEQLPDLHKLKSLRQLDILECPKLKNFPEEFGQVGAFPLLEIFSVSLLDHLEELPIIEEGAMPSLKLLTIMLCEALKVLPENFRTFQKLQKIRIFGCSIILENLENIKKINTTVEVVTLSTEETQEAVPKFGKLLSSLEGWLHGEFRNHELFRFWEELTRGL